MQAPTQWKRSVLFLIISVPPSILCLECYFGKDDKTRPTEGTAGHQKSCAYTFMIPCEFKHYPDLHMFRTENRKDAGCVYRPKLKRFTCFCNSHLCNGNITFIRELLNENSAKNGPVQCVSDHLQNRRTLLEPYPPPPPPPTTTTTTTTATTAITKTTTLPTTSSSTTATATTLATEKLVTTAKPTQATNAPAATAASTTATSANGTTTDATIVTSAAANALTQSNTSAAEHVERDSENDTTLELNATRVPTTTSTIMASTMTTAHLVINASSPTTQRSAKMEIEQKTATTASTQKSKRVSSSSDSEKEKHKQSTYSTKRDMVAGNKKKEALHMSDEPEVPSSFFAFGILAIVAAVLLCLVLPVVAGYLIAKKRRRNGKPENPESGAMPTGSRESVKNAAVPQTKAPEPSKAKASEQPEVKSQEAIQKDQPKNQSKEPVNAGSAEKGSAAKAENPEPQSL